MPAATMRCHRRTYSLRRPVTSARACASSELISLLTTLTARALCAWKTTCEHIAAANASAGSATPATAVS